MGRETIPIQMVRMTILVLLLDRNSIDVYMGTGAATDPTAWSVMN
jgi:hypothetical protein